MKSGEEDDVEPDGILGIRTKKWLPLALGGAGASGLVVLGLCWPDRDAHGGEVGSGARGTADPVAVAEYEKEIEPLLADFCFDCHGDGAAKGDVSLDTYETVAAHLGNRELWLRMYQNVRTHLMPPSDEDFQPEPEERDRILRWIEKKVFKLDPANPDPGRVTIRRLNREEYRNTIRDLLGVDFNVTENFPADDTGYGFDTIGDVLTLSPLLLEKYLAASEEIAARALPRDAGKPKPLRIDAGEFREPGNNNQSARFMEAEIEHTVRAERDIPHGGKYRLSITYHVEGEGQAKGHTATWRVLVDGKELERREVRWDRRGRKTYSKEVELTKGRHRFELHIAPGQPSENPQEKMGVRVEDYRLQGPEGVEVFHLYPESYRKIFFKGLPPTDPKKRAGYMREIVARFAGRAFRRPADPAVVERLTAMALAKAGEEGMKFVDGVELAVTAMLTSPRFLFRSEIQPEPDNPGKVVPIDEYALASRLSYFLWSSMPDDELLELAKKGALRKQLRAQVDRMLGDEKAQRMVRNFVGQWLQVRDLEGLHVDARRILNLRDRQQANRIFSREIRRDMKRETEMFFGHLLGQNRPVMELLTANYSFLNERLGKFYGMNDVRGGEFRRVEFDDRDVARGGILTQGTFLIVTSNPTRTSPVKRGLFVLENILGTPAPPAPPDVPELEEAQKQLGENPTMRQMMEVHREKALCKSCHARMDPIGLALENFNALGQWRDNENGQPIDSAGQLVTGETFGNVMELKKILATSRQEDFQRCLTEKMLTYAIGRGVEYYDAPTVNKIVAEMRKNGGRIRELIYGVVESAPFQKRRGDGERLR